MNVSTTGNLISKLRKEAGYTQKSLASALNITDKAISKWERGICLPDVSLLPKLSLLLDADISLFISSEREIQNRWIGYLDFRDYSIDLRQKIYDKPMVYYILSHFLLLGITDIYIKTTPQNVSYLSDTFWGVLGFNFIFDFDKIPECNVMRMEYPCFLFGSDLTRQFQGAMVAEGAVRLIPEGVESPFIFLPAKYKNICEEKDEMNRQVISDRTLGRGMVCIKLDDQDKIMDASWFVKMYQANTGVLIGSLEEIALKKGIISKEQFAEIGRI